WRSWRMRACIAALPLLFLAGGCSLPEAGSPLGRPVYSGPAIATLGSADVTVTLRLDRFGMRVRNASGSVLLDTFDGDSTVAGDDAHAYGALGATYHQTQFTPTIIEGWDHVLGTDQPWRHATSVAAAAVTATSASIDLFDPADQGTTLHVDIAVDGTMVRFEATIAALSTAA